MSICHIFFKRVCDWYISIMHVCNNATDKTLYVILGPLGSDLTEFSRDPWKKNVIREFQLGFPLQFFPTWNLIVQIKQ